MSGTARDAPLSTLGNSHQQLPMASKGSSANFVPSTQPLSIISVPRDPPGTLDFRKLTVIPFCQERKASSLDCAKCFANR